VSAAASRHSLALARGEIVVHVSVEIERALFDQTHHREREHRLADRAGLDASWPLPHPPFSHARAEAARPRERAVIDHADARAGVA